MRPPLPDPLISRLSDSIAAQIGLHFSKERWSELERKIAAAAPKFGMPNAESCARWLLSAPLTRNQIEVLASHLTVGETYFFRDKRSLEALETHIFPALLRASSNTARRLRIWSAGCCTGEEAYSVAILLDRLIPDPTAWNITILATDINPEFLRKAAEGVYNDWSFRDAPTWLRERYFKRNNDGRFEIHPQIRERVTFSYLNLAEDVYPSLLNNTNAMDVILCRNVLMYFAAARARNVVENFHGSLVDGGWFIVSPTETSTVLSSRFTAIEFPGTMLYRKLAHADPRFIATGYPTPGVGPSPEVSSPPAPVLVAGPPVQEAAHSVPPMRTHHEPDRLEEAEQGEARPRQQDEPDALSRTARAFANQGRLAEAIEWCEKAIAADKLDPAFQYLLATIQQEQGRSDVAVRSLMRALYLDPGFVLAHFALGNLRLSQGRRREAERHLEDALVLLHARPQSDVLPESEGLTAGRLGEIIATVRSRLPPASVEGA